MRAPMQSAYTVGDIFKAYGAFYRDTYGSSMSIRQHRAMRAIEICRTAELGGHVDMCDSCGHLRISYNSCRNRHCSQCQNLEKERWLDARNKELLPIQYFHVTATIPEQLRPISLRNQRLAYALLFKSIARTLQELSVDPKHLGAQIGFTAILHTWSQTLMFHPHVHCIVPGGGLSLDSGRWISCKEDFFIHYEVLSRKFRGKFLHYLKEAYNAQKLKFPGKIGYLQDRSAFGNLLTELYSRDWVVNCKPTIHNTALLIDYLGRYVYRVAISDDRILNLQDDMVTFRYRDSVDSDKYKTMRLAAFEFIRRFLFHILPDRFVKIRHYGILGSRNKKTKLVLCQKLLGVEVSSTAESAIKETWVELLERVTGMNPLICPKCGQGKMGLKEILPIKTSRSPP